MAGDTIRLTVVINGQRNIDEGQTSSFLKTRRFRLLTRTPAIGSGDMNGDSEVNIVDVTILRRLLAGLPVN